MRNFFFFLFYEKINKRPKHPRPKQDVRFYKYEIHESTNPRNSKKGEHCTADKG